MARGRLDPPNLDDRTWRQLVDQIQALIPHYAPEWTDRNPSDLGMTLIELFAWLVEGLIYRLNRVPEKNYIAFLNLLGITRTPARPATTWLTWKADNAAVKVPKGTQVATEQTEQIAGVVFETDADLRVLPINLVAALLTDGNTCQDISGDLVTKPLKGHLLELDSSQSVMIALGFDQRNDEALVLHVARALASGGDKVQVEWCYSTAANSPNDWPKCSPTADETLGLQKSGAVTLKVPADWGKQKPASWPSGPAEGSQERFWIGVRLTPSTIKQQIGLAHILFNSVSATNALTITQPEVLGKSDGTPFKNFELAHRPLWKRPGTPDPYDHLQVEVRELQLGGAFGAWLPWTRVEQLAPGDARAYRLDPVTGTLHFGDYNASRPNGHGMIPPDGSEIRAVRYRYVDGGAWGNVGSETIKVTRSAIPSVTFKNPGPATGGADEEALADTLRRAPELLRGSTRAVTAEDYEHLAREASPGVRKVRCLPPRLDDDLAGYPSTYGGLLRSNGHLNLIIVPAATLSDARPQPTRDLIEQVHSYLDVRRSLTTRLQVTGPRYLPINIEIKINLWKRALPLGEEEKEATKAWYEAQIKEKIARFLHPLLGGPQGQGWEIGQSFLISDLLEYIKLPTSVGYIADPIALAGGPAYTPSDRPKGMVPKGAWVQLADYELLCNGEPKVGIEES